MITFFSIPKPFLGHIEIIQRNAIQSWKLLHPECEVILFGDEYGIKEFASKHEIRHIPEIKRNEYGTPLVSDSFNQAQNDSKSNILCYVNADIIFLDDVSILISEIIKTMNRFLIVGRRWDLDIKNLLNFDVNWQLQMVNQLNLRGKLHPKYGIDYFIFTKNLFDEIPDFAVGRPGWDNWMIYYARSLHCPVIDASDAITAIHQNHDYSHVPQRTGPKYNGPEGERNLALTGGSSHRLTIDDANYKLTKRILREKTMFGFRKSVKNVNQWLLDSIRKYA